MKNYYFILFVFIGCQSEELQRSGKTREGRPDAESWNAIITLTNKGAKRGVYIRKAGLDFQTGDVGIPKNKRLTSRDIGLAAAMNVPWILVRRRPRIAIIATGDEIVRPGELTSKNQIVSSNSYTLHAFLTALGADVQILGVIYITCGPVNAFVFCIWSNDFLRGIKCMMIRCCKSK